MIDEGNREALRKECSTSIESARLLKTMNQLIEVYEAPKAIRVCRGLEMTSETLTEWAKEMGIAVLFTHPDKPNQNTFVEMFNISFVDIALNDNLLNLITEAQ